MHCWSVRHGRWTPLIHLPTTGYDPSIASAGHPSLTCSAHLKSFFFRMFQFLEFSLIFSRTPLSQLENPELFASRADSRYPSPASDSSECPTSRLSPSAPERSKTRRSAACSSVQQRNNSESLLSSQAFFPISACFVCVEFRSVCLFVYRACRYFWFACP